MLNNTHVTKHTIYTSLFYWIAILDWTNGLLDWTTGILDCITRLDHWNTGLYYWTGILDWTTGILDCITGLEYLTGLLDYWTTKLVCVFIYHIQNNMQILSAAPKKEQHTFR